MLSCLRQATSALCRNLRINGDQYTKFSLTSLKPVSNFFENNQSQSPSSSSSSWISDNKWAVLLGCLITSGAVAFYLSNLETIPYTSSDESGIGDEWLEDENRIGDEWLEDMRERVLKDKLLPATHPDSQRVESIFKNIVSASRSHHHHEKHHQRHLEQLNWEVMVVDDPEQVAYSMTDGKVVLSTFLLRLFSSEAAIAWVIGHEVGHIIANARHSADAISKFVPWLPYDVASDFPAKQLWRPSILHRSEFEADYIGMLLMASAGYHPRSAPRVLEKFALVFYEDEKIEYATHPPSKERARCLAQPKVMEEALALYKKFEKQKFRERCRIGGLADVLSPDPLHMRLVFGKSKRPQEKQILAWEPLGIRRTRRFCP